MVSAFHRTVKDFHTFGRQTRKRVPRSSHADFSPRPSRPDPIALLEEQNTARLPWLVPIRHGRMSTSAFAFYRGSAKIMAADLAMTPISGINAQICGDAHLSNFGVYGSPERELVFDINDFDETLSGPWEWDVKRLATSFVIAARHNEFSRKEGLKIARESVHSYRQAMAAFAGMSYLDIWYSQARYRDVAEVIRRPGSKKDRKRIEKFETKARGRNRIRDLSKLTKKGNGQRRIVADPPFIVPFDEMPEAGHPVEAIRAIREGYDHYRSTLSDDLRVLLDRYQPVDFALKVVGVGSVGTRSFIMLLEGRDRKDPLFLQMKESTNSVLEDQLPPSPYANHGQRVVEGQRLMQATSDIFLGWARSVRGHDFYWRQLKDMKGSAEVDETTQERLHAYARVCGWTLAHAHARSGDPSAIAGYLGSGELFDVAVTEFAEKYADQNDRDFKAFKKAIKSGRLPYAPGYGDE